MDTKAQSTLDDFLAAVRDEEIAPEQRAWMNEQIRKALDRKRSGKATYKSLDEVRRDFGF